MNRPRHEILNKIRACLNIADPKSGTTDHERSTAKAMAEKLMKEHKVTSKELGKTNSDLIVTFSYTEEDNLSAAFDSLRKRGIKPRRGWSNPPGEQK